MLVTIIVIAYYIIYPSRGFLHSDSTDTILWAQAAFDAKSLLNPDFYYACLLPFGGQLLMLPFFGVFGFSTTTHILGMLSFLAVFVTSMLVLLKTLKWNIRWSALLVSVLLLTVSGSDKLREIFWGHIIYYSLGIFFLFVGLAMVFKIIQLETSKRNSIGLKSVGLHLMLFIWVALCTTNGLQALVIFVLPLLGALLLERFLDFDKKLFSLANLSTFVLSIVIVLGLVTGHFLGKLIIGDLVGGYAEAYSSYSDPNNWIQNAMQFFPQWATLLGVTVRESDKFMSMDGIINLIKIFFSIIIIVVPFVMLFFYKQIQERSTRILLLVHWLMTALIMIGYVFGLLSAANWRLSPIVCTSAFSTILFIKWLSTQKNMQRIQTVLLIPIVLVCSLTAVQVGALNPNGQPNQINYDMKDFLASKDLTYGYSTFWNANIITLLSDSKIISRTVNIDDNGISPVQYQSNSKWYQEQAGQSTYYLLLSRDEYNIFIASEKELYETRKEEYEFNGYMILVFDKNLF